MNKQSLDERIEEYTLINARCMVYGHEVNDKGFCTMESCGYSDQNYSLALCNACNQMTNHVSNACMKCKLTTPTKGDE